MARVPQISGIRIKVQLVPSALQDSSGNQAWLLVFSLPEPCAWLAPWMALGGSMHGVPRGMREGQATLQGLVTINDAVDVVPGKGVPASLPGILTGIQRAPARKRTHKGADGHYTFVSILDTRWNSRAFASGKETLWKGRQAKGLLERRQALSFPWPSAGKDGTARDTHGAHTWTDCQCMTGRNRLINAWKHLAAPGEPRVEAPCSILTGRGTSRAHRLLVRGG